MRSLLIVFAAVSAIACCTQAAAEPRTPGASVTMCRTNKMIGYGVVAGLDGTGDSFARSPMSLAILKAALRRTNQPDFDPTVFEHRVAGVMVVAQLKSCAYSDGSYDLKMERTVDLSVAALGDGKSIQGGALLLTPLVGADGKTYAMGQGVLQPRPGSKNPNEAFIPGGGVVAK